MLQKLLPAIALAITYFASSASASLVYLGTINGNDTNAAIPTIKTLIFNTTGVNADITRYDKTNDATILTTLTPSSGTSGTWDVTDNSVLISYLTIKASNKYAVYQVDAPANSGAWTTEKLTNGQGIPHELSHMSLWTVPGAPGNDPSVPEPSTLISMAAGAFGLLAFRKFRS